MHKYKVCVYCTAYNHEKYIKKTLNGFVNQVTNFKFYCIIHDDASTDKTALIIKEYEKKYPDLIKGIYQTENQYSKNVNIIEKFISPNVNSDYVAICEGDDYWIDNLKLQKQVEALESNKDCFMCVHKTIEVYEDEISTGITYPKEDYKKGRLDINKLLSNDYSIHTSSYMFVYDKWISYINNPPYFKQICDVGDVPYILYFAYIGKIYYIPESMSCYRRGVPTSWSVSRINKSDEKIINNICKHSKIMSDTYFEYNVYTNARFRKICEKKRAYFLFQYSILSKQRIFLSNINLFWRLDIKKKIFIILSVFLPELTKNIYLNRLKSLYKISMGLH